MANVGGRAHTDRSDDQAEALRFSTQPFPVAFGERTAACLSLARSAYSLKALVSTAYKLSDRYAVLIDEDGADRWALFVITQQQSDLRGAVEAIVRELADQQLRALLEEQFSPMRTLIVAQAFAEGNLLDVERDAADHNTDPQGTGRRR